MNAQPEMRKPPALASDAQIRFVLGLTEPHRLERLTTAEARYLIGWLRGPPETMSRSQQLYIASLIDELSRDQVSSLVEHLRGLVAPPAAEVLR